MSVCLFVCVKLVCLFVALCVLICFFSVQFVTKFIVYFTDFLSVSCFSMCLLSYVLLHGMKLRPLVIDDNLK